jgi:hypothetical protein
MMMQVPYDFRPRLSGLQVAAHNYDRGRPGGYGARQVGPDQYVWEESRRPAPPNWDSGPSGPAPDISRPKTSPASALWPNLPTAG